MKRYRGVVWPEGVVVIDHEYTNEIVCPYCGYEHPDSWEVNFGPGMEGDTVRECAECGETFTATRMVRVEYSTSKNVVKKPGAA